MKQIDKDMAIQYTVPISILIVMLTILAVVSLEIFMGVIKLILFLGIVAAVVCGFMWLVMRGTSVVVDWLNARSRK